MKISNIVARRPGSAHDAAIFINSRIFAKFEDFGNCALLGTFNECKLYIILQRQGFVKELWLL